jgi:phytol kinase
MLLCYAYVLFIIFIVGKMNSTFGVSRKATRTLLHAMIGNLVFVVPFFTISSYPFLVALPFILVTYLVSPYSQSEAFKDRLKGLAGITEEGHHLGLVMYSISYSILALLYASEPQVIAAGILPLAYGDSAASTIGERYGRRRYRILEEKSLEGSAAMFLGSFLSVGISLPFLCSLGSFSLAGGVIQILIVAAVAAFVEGVSPKGLDNLTVPAFAALAFILTSGSM